MRKAIFVITLASAVLMVSTCAKRKKGRCRLRYKSVDTSESTIYLACQDQMRISEKPPHLKDLPRRVSKAISYFLVKIGGRDIPLIIDSAKKYKLYLDTDGDGYLSDERCFAARTVRKRRFGSIDYYKFGPISVEFGRAETKLDKRIYVITRSTSIERICFCPADYRTGKVRLGEYIYSVAVVDGNFDGKYGKILSPPIKNPWRPGCDSFAIDLNRNGQLDVSFYNHSELMPFNKMLKVGSSYYGININESGTALELNKIQPEFGTLDLGKENVKLNLLSDTAQQSISNFNKNSLIPAGRYQALLIEWSQLDSEKNVWSFTCYRDAGALCDFEVTKNQTASFKIGPPFKIITTAQQNRNTVSIDCTLLGQAGEQYRPNFKKNGIQVSPAVLRIIDEAGNVVYSGRFKYG